MGSVYCSQHQKLHEKPNKKHGGNSIEQSWAYGYDVFPEQVDGIPIEERIQSRKSLLGYALRTTRDQPIPLPKSLNDLLKNDPFFYTRHSPIMYYGKMSTKDIASRIENLNKEAISNCGPGKCLHYLRYEPVYDEFIYHVFKATNKAIYHWFYVHKVNIKSGHLKLVGYVEGEHDDINKIKRFFPMMIAPIV